MSGFNMPPGVSPGDIPGNEPDDWREEGEHQAQAVLTLRDYFAAKAAAGICASKDEAGELIQHGYEWIARESYAIADAMLKERAK